MVAGRECSHSVGRLLVLPPRPARAQCTPSWCADLALAMVARAPGPLPQVTPRRQSTKGAAGGRGPPEGGGAARRSKFRSYDGVGLLWEPVGGQLREVDGARVLLRLRARISSLQLKNTGGLRRVPGTILSAFRLTLGLFRWRALNAIVFGAGAGLCADAGTGVIVVHKRHLPAARHPRCRHMALLPAV